MTECCLSYVYHYLQLDIVHSKSGKTLTKIGDVSKLILDFKHDSLYLLCMPDFPKYCRSVIFACLNFTKFRICNFFFLFSSSIIIIIFARFSNSRTCPSREICEN